MTNVTRASYVQYGMKYEIVARYRTRLGVQPRYSMEVSELAVLTSEQ